MSWESFYLICFLVGLGLSAFSLLAGFGRLHLPSRLHIGHAGHPGHFHHGSASGTQRIPFFNFSSLMAFLAWFGGTGYLLTRYSSVWVVFAFGIAMISGLAAAAIVSFFLIKVLLAHDSSLDSAEFNLVGMLGRVNVRIRPGGTGEIIFSQKGTRHCAGARSEDGQAIAKGTEVIVTRYDKGIAYVRGWDEMVGEKQAADQAQETK